MQITGKAKEAFEKWYSENFKKPLEWTYDEDGKVIQPPSIMRFEILPDPMQYGVYVDFFDSVGIQVNVTGWLMFTYSISYGTSNVKRLKGDTYKTRPEARTAAIEKANEIYNERT